jgi:hypothetical protein
MERAEVALGRLSLASVVAPSPLSPPTTEPDGDPMVERVAELYGPLSPRARATSPVASACDPTAMVVTPVLKIMPGLQSMCEMRPVSSPSSEHLKVDLLVPVTMACESNSPLKSSLVAGFEEGDAPVIDVMQSHESIEQVVHAGGDVVVAGVPKPNFEVTFAIKLCEFLTKLDPDKSGKIIGCLMREKGLWTEKGSRGKCKKDGARPQSGPARRNLASAKARKVMFMRRQ